MKFWSYIGEFFLFSWLVELFKKHERREGVNSGERFLDNDLTDDFDVHPRYGSGHSRFDCDDYGYNQSVDDFLDEQDDYDMMDDDF